MFLEVKRVIRGETSGLQVDWSHSELIMALWHRSGDRFNLIGFLFFAKDFFFFSDGLHSVSVWFTTIQPDVGDWVYTKCKLRCLSARFYWMVGFLVESWWCQQYTIYALSMIPNTYSNLPIVIDTEAYLFGSLNTKQLFTCHLGSIKKSLKNLFFLYVLQVSWKSWPFFVWFLCISTWMIFEKRMERPGLAISHRRTSPEQFSVGGDPWGFWRKGDDASIEGKEILRFWSGHH